MEQNRRIATYLATPGEYDRALHVVKTQLRTSGEDDPNSLSGEKLVQHANGLFTGGHDMIITRRHCADGATNDTQNASVGTLAVTEYRAYTGYTIDSMRNLYNLSQSAGYVTAPQSWL